MFDCVKIPTPFQVGHVNCYASGSTLIDPGPDSDDAFETLESALLSRDQSIDDIERVLITHPHPDHFGLASRLQERGASILASSTAASIIGDFPGRLAYEQSYFEPFFISHGLRADVVSTMVELPEAFLEFAQSVDVDRTIDDGETVHVGDNQLGVEAVEGHAPGELIFTFDTSTGECAIVGDHVLDPITPNPFLQPPPTPEHPRPRVLPAYNASLDRLAERSFTRMLPGHRDEIDRPTHRIEQLRRFHEHRSERTEAEVSEPKTAAQVMRGLFGELPVTEIFSGMSEAIGHLDVLEERGRVTREMSGGTIQYVASSDQ